LRRPEPVVGVPGWHLNVGDDHVRLVCTGFPEQVGRVSRHADDVKPRLLEHAHNPLARQRLILAYHHAHTSSVSHVLNVRRSRDVVSDNGLPFAA